MPLVTYSDSDDGDQDGPPISKSHSGAPPVTSSVNAGTKRKLSDLPPLPTAFHDLYATNVRTATSDDQALHGGRKRQVPHVEGHWPTHVYLEWHPTPDEAQRLQALISPIASAAQNVHSLLQSDLGAPIPLHISLSRSLSLHTNERDAFLSQLRAKIKAAGVNHFQLRFDTVAWYPNYERNRWFLSLGAKRPSGDELNRLLHASNEGCYAMGYPELYVPPRSQNESENSQTKRKKRRESSTESASADGIRDCSEAFHVSLAWSLETQALTSEVSIEQFQDLYVDFDCVKVKIGNAVTSLPFEARRMSQHS